MFRSLLLVPGLLVALAPVWADDSESIDILMIAGPPSHGYGAHEHYAGLKILEESLEASNPRIDATVVRGWPEDAESLEEAESIVIYCDGGRRHVAMDHRDELRSLLADGRGLVCLHYAVEMLPGESGRDWVELLGGHFEINWSVNPHWVADFKTLPEHPITRGVEPFSANDEWYFHLRFAEQGVTPILAAVAPESTMRRKDGHHSGNPHVRKSVAAGEMQTVAWAYDRPDGGRSFGFTGGHFHWNWGHEDFRRLVTNAIRWTAGDEIDREGSRSKSINMPKLLTNQDYERPEDFSPEKVAEEFNLTSAPAEEAGDAEAAPKQSGARQGASAEPRLLEATPLVTTETSPRGIDLDVALRGARDLFLVVTDGGDGYQCDWADWIDPVLHGADGKRQSLVELPWESATSGFGEPHKDANCQGRPLRVRGRRIESPGIGTHADSVIHYRIPEGYQRLTVTAALDNGGTDQQDGKATSVRFAVYADAPPADLDALDDRINHGQRDPDNAVAGLEVAPGLELTLVASEPQLRSLTNLDIDDRGRIWVCDVMNYRRRNGARPEGDRILILEDTTGDGVADEVKTFYQGRDIDSAMGLCVLPGAKGTEVIVSASPTVWRFVDEDGDDIPDRKEAMFTETGQPQHDHSAHSFLFGPDGKLYWNFGNTGGQVKNAQGETVIDIHGRAVVDNGSPFYGGMPFRCDLDGSNFEVLAHNFRNNWETTVDSFGTLWQSDNDDDGNRGTRINFVMEQGNYGYRDELTGAGWREDRITMEDEIPLQHWHLNDPGVVPNLLQTGAGSPCGMCLYEGRLLPQRFWDEMIHCEPGHNVVRAYPVEPQGAGYTATIEPLVTGKIDKWFRPADVCVAPDGSLFVTDWYDPGVGGHRQGDSDRGRLFRIAPPGTPYRIPRYDFSTAEGATEALRSPTRSIRYRAWQTLHAMGREAEPALLEMFADENPRMRARALWLLGKIDGRGKHYVERALSDGDPDIRITGIRLAKQLGLAPSVACRSVVDDESAAVRRELAIALRFDESPAMPGAWAQLAAGHDGKDRWYLEALGIGSDLRASECYAAWLEEVGGNWNTPAGRDIVWRIRAPEAAEALVAIIADESLPLEETDRYFRSLEYHPPRVRTAALEKLLP